MGVYSIVSNDASVGTTIGSFDAIDTRNGTVSLRDGTNHVVGISYVIARAAQTTGTAMMARLRVSSADIGLAAGAADFMLSTASGAGIATNSGGWPSPVRWISTDWGAKAGTELSYSLSQSGIEPADNWSAQIGTAHAAGGMPPAKWFDAASVGGTLPLQGSVSSNGGSTTLARTTLVSTTIPGRFTQLVSWQPIGIGDAAQTTAEPSTSFAEITSTIGDFDLQEWPHAGTNAGLGTIVGTGLWLDQDPLPFYFKKEGSNRTIEPFITGLGTTTGAQAYGYSMGLRE